MPELWQIELTNALIELVRELPRLIGAIERQNKPLEEVLKELKRL